MEKPLTIPPYMGGTDALVSYGRLRIHQKSTLMNTSRQVKNTTYTCSSRYQHIMIKEITCVTLSEISKRAQKSQTEVLCDNRLNGTDR